MGFDITFHGISRDLEGFALRQLLDGETTVDNLVSSLPNCTDDLPSVCTEWYQSTNLGDQVDEEGDRAFKSALNHCIDNSLSFIEVSDVYSPMAGASINVEKSVNAKHLQADG